MVIIDAWMQHPSAELLADPMFDSLRRWAPGQLGGGEAPLEATVAAMDAAGVRIGTLCAWWGPPRAADFQRCRGRGRQPVPGPVRRGRRGRPGPP